MFMNVYYLVCITMSVMQNAVCNCEIKPILTYLLTYQTLSTIFTRITNTGLRFRNWTDNV